MGRKYNNKKYIGGIIMRIGFCFDCKEDYACLSDDLSFCDFISPTAITFVKESLEKCGHQITLVGNYKKLLECLNQGITFDLIISAAEGISSRSRESWIASICELHNLPYAGSDTYTLVVTLDKILTKVIANYLDVPTPNFVEITSIEDAEKLSFEYPAILKPNYEGSSMGVKLINTKEDLIEHAKLLFEKYKDKLILEEYISGKEITVSIIERNGTPYVFGMVESLQQNNQIMPIYSSEIKRIFGCKKILPRISDETKLVLTDYALRMYSYLKCNDYSRIDFRLDQNDNPYLLEVTPLPALSETASFMMAAKLNNIDHADIFNDIVNNSCYRFASLPKS